MKILILFACLTIFAVLPSGEAISEHCKELFDENIHPNECCRLPSREILDKHKEKCKSLCKNDEKSKLQAGCCELDCIYSATGVLRNGEVVTDAVIELYENYLQKQGGGRFDKWMEIVEGSVVNCARAAKRTSDALVCNIPEHFMDLLDCIDSQNFLNCPSPVESKACEKTRSIFVNESECGKTFNGLFVVDHRIWNKRD